jgi:hypothetical protein
MTGYLRQIAARSAGLSAVSTTEMTPPRVSAFSIPTPLGPPRPYPLPDEAGSPLDSQTAPAQSNADVNLNPLTPKSPAASSEDNRSSIPTARTSAMPAREVTPPPVVSRGDSVPTISKVKDVPSPSQTRKDSSEIEPPTVRVEPASVSIFPTTPTPTSPREDQLGEEVPESLSANFELPPSSIQKAEREAVERDDAAASYKEEGTPHVVVRLEPAPRAGAFEFQAQPAATPIDGRYVTETQVLPLLTRERLVHAAQLPAEVRVTIGRVDVRLESNTPPAPVVNQPAASGDPFASLALARRGWRTPF